ncbi:MAG: hypothetical protein AABX95_03390 [Nanoarchaeota archaeon]
MAKRIEVHHNKTLNDLEWERGEIIGVHPNSKSQWYDFVLMETVAFTPERPFIQDYDIPFLGVSYSPPDEKRELWRIGFEGRALFLRKPEKDKNGDINPNYQYARKIKNTEPFDVETVLAGKEQILSYLREPNSKRHGCDFYADCIEDGRLMLEKGILGIFAEFLAPGHASDTFRFRGSLLARLLKQWTA